MITFNVTNRYSGEVQFTAKIDCKKDESTSIKLGLAVKWAIKAGAYLASQWIIQGAVRSDGYAFMLTNYKDDGVRVKAGCRNFTLAEAHKHWKATRNGTPLGDETLSILDCLEAMAKARGLDLKDK